MIIVVVFSLARMYVSFMETGSRQLVSVISFYHNNP